MRGSPIPYSDQEMAWLEANFRMVISDYHAAFVAAFSRDDIEAKHLHALRKRKGWKVGREPGRYVGRLLAFNATEIAWLREHCTMSIGAYHEAFQEAFDRPDLTPQKLHALRKRQGWKTGRDGRFAPGNVPASKGKPAPFHPNSAATRFKKGAVPANAKPLGHERVRAKDGYIEISVDQRNPYTGAPQRYVMKHKWLWEQANGPVPKGMALKCLDGDKYNFALDNWEPVPRGLLPRLNGKSGRNYERAPAALKPAILAVAKLEHRIAELRK